jgi:hypothetical protein
MESHLFIFYEIYPDEFFLPEIVLEKDFKTWQRENVEASPLIIAKRSTKITRTKNKGIGFKMTHEQLPLEIVFRHKSEALKPLVKLLENALFSL